MKLPISSSKSLSTALHSAIIAILLLSISACSSHRPVRLKNKSIKEWESYQFREVEKSDKVEAEKWIIYSRKIQGTDFLEYKIEGAIKATAGACIQAFKQEIIKQATDTNNKKYPTYDIVSESIDSCLTYVIHEEPFPLKNTEMSIRYIYFNEEDGSTGVKWKEAWEETKIPISKKLSRVESFRGSWSFIPTDSNTCKAINSVHFNPMGMPLWLIKPMVVHFLKNGLKSTREATSNTSPKGN